MATTVEQRRQKRVKQTAEVFTPPALVNEMLDKLPEEVWAKEKTFCDPACGNGNFLVEVLNRKLKRGHTPLDALKTVFGVDIEDDNVAQCRIRLLKAISAYEPVEEKHVRVVTINIVKINIKKHPGGALDYDFSFKNKNSQKDIDLWMEKIANGILDSVDPPEGLVSETKFGKRRDIFA